MQKICLLILFSLYLDAAFSQSVYENIFGPVIAQPCPFDQNETVTYPKDWVIYQTTDGNFNGPRDSTRCISAETGNTQYYVTISLDQIDPSEPLFVRALPGAFINLSSLFPNAVYNAQVSGFLTDPNATLEDGVACTQDLCSGLFVGIGIPGDLRYQTGMFNVFNGIPTDFNLFTCFPTEYFIDQSLKDLVLKFQFAPGSNLNGKFLALSYISISLGSEFVSPITSVQVDPSYYNNSTGEYEINVSQATQAPFVDVYLMEYTAPTFPGPLAPSYIIGSITPNSAQQEVINLSVFPGQVLEIQPFTYLLGSLAEGSDTLRHKVNLVNEGGDFCLNFVDFIFSGGDEYRHSGGTLNLNNPFSCMQFRKGSALRVTEGATLHYGNNGAGMLALCAEGTIALERDATLLVDCLLNLSECNNDLPPQQIYMDLPPGARLIFTDHARLTNRYSLGQQMKLNVRMLGGTIDDEALAAEDRALIHRVYPEPEPDLARNISVTPNPFGTTPTISYLAGADEQVQLCWTDMQGRLVYEEKKQAYHGMNEWQVDLPLAPGMYLLMVETPAGKVTTKVLKGK